MSRRALSGLAMAGLVLLAAGCRVMEAGTAASSTAPGSAESSPMASAPAASGVPLGDVTTIDVEELRRALLGEEPYPSGWDEQVDEIVAQMQLAIDGIRIPDVTGLDPTAASCALWMPLVGNTLWATGAFLERQVFIGHAGALAQVAADAIRPAAAEAFATASAAAAEQMQPDGDPAVIGEHPYDAIETIGRWAVSNCVIPVEVAEAPDTEGWTDEEIAQSCEWDRSWLADAQEEYRAGPGDGLYAEHPHLLEVTIHTYAYTQWHRAVVDNGANPPSLGVEPIPGGFCDR